MGNAEVLEATGHRWQMLAPGAPLERATFELPRRPAGRAVVRVAGCGVCHTDLGFLFDGVAPRAGFPLTLGHEVSGIVTDAGSGFEELVGRAVIVPAVTPCGECATCRAGHGTICRRQEMPGNDAHGGFATHLDVPAHGLCVLDGDGAELANKGEIERSGCTLSELAVVADAVTTPYQAIRRARVEPGDFVVVIGLGGVGGFAAQIAHALGATVCGIEPNEARRDALEPYGLDLALAPDDDGRATKARLRDFAKQRGAPAERWKIFECSGTAAGQALAWSLLVHGAYLSVVGFTMQKLEVRLSNLMAFDAKAVGNWGCLPELYPEALRLVLDGRVAVAPFVETFPMDDVWEVLNRVHDGKTTKRPVLRP